MNTPASTTRSHGTVIFATTLFGAVITSFGAIPASPLMRDQERWLPAIATFLLALWGAAFGATSARARIAGRAQNRLAWGAVLVAIPQVLITCLTIAAAVSSSAHRGNMWPLDVIFEAIFGLGAGLLFAAAGVVGAFVCIPLIQWTGSTLFTESQRGDSTAIVRKSLVFVCTPALLRLALDRHLDGTALVAVVACACAILAIRERGAPRWYPTFPIALLLITTAALFHQRHIERVSRDELAAPNQGPCCYTSRIDIHEASRGRGAYAVAAERVPGVSHARAIFLDGYYDESTGRPRVSVAIELSSGAPEAATLHAAATALANVSCHVCTDEGGGEMSPHVMLGREVPVDVSVVATARAGSDLEAIRAATERVIAPRLTPATEWFATEDNAGVGIAQPTVAEIGIPGVTALSVEINGFRANGEGYIRVPLPVGEHVTLRRVEVRIAPALDLDGASAAVEAGVDARGD